MSVRLSTMKAVVRDAYGGPEVLRLLEVPRPEMTDVDVLVRVAAVSVNRVDWYLVTGTPYLGRLQLGLSRPKRLQIGMDFAGTVEAVGGKVTDFQPGDEVFGGRGGAFAEYVSVEAAIALKPAHLSFEEAAAVPLAGITALQGLRDKGGLQPGQRVLINGASGGVGTFAVQIAKELGADVTAVCSTRNVEQARSLGADHVIDYTREDFTRSDQRYDLMFDNAGSRPWSHCRRVLMPKATVVLVGGHANRVLGPLGHVAKVRLAALSSQRRTTFLLATYNRADMEYLRQLLEARSLSPVIDRQYGLQSIAEAVGYMGEGHARGKIVVSMSMPSTPTVAPGGTSAVLRGP
jgi:NADPH:quinone reductase-like Zn-dependent oxidoreductase